MLLPGHCQKHLLRLIQVDQFWRSCLKNSEIELTKKWQSQLVYNTKELLESWSFMGVKGEIKSIYERKCLKMLYILSCNDSAYVNKYLLLETKLFI